MPSSIGHALAGLAVSRLFGGNLREDWPHVVLATAPDLDIALGIARGRRIDYSLRRTHSLGAAVAAGLCAAAAAGITGRGVLREGLKASTSYSSHLLLDYFGKESGHGLPLLWPASKKRFSSPRPVFRTIYSSGDEFVKGLLTRRNIRRVAREVAIISPALAAAVLLRRRGHL